MLVIVPLLAVWYQECAEALADAVATHDEVGQGKVDVAALIDKNGPPGARGPSFGGS